jgi:tetratricopeptide (TPR) repeat protein
MTHRAGIESHRRRWIAGALGGFGVAGIAALVALVGVRPAPARRAPPENAVASEAYAEGRYWWNKRDAESLQRALALFQESLDLDPTNAAAYSGRADTYARLGQGGYLAPADAFPKAAAAARTALQLDSTLAEPHAALGNYFLYYEWDWERADTEFRQALAGNPDDATAREWYSLFLAVLGHFDEAEAQLRRAADLDPLSVTIANTGAWIAHLAGKPGELDSLSRIRLAAGYPALGHAGLGERDRAFESLDQAAAQRAPWLVWLNRDRRWDKLRGDPRFTRLLRRVGLPP